MTLLAIQLLIALIVVAWLTAAGMAVRSVSRIWLRHWAERQLRGAEAAVKYLERPHRLLTAVNAGVAVTLLFAGVAIGLNDTGTRLAIDALVFTGLVVIFGQLLPRTIARRWPVIVAPFVLPLLQLTDVVTRPILAIGRMLARIVVWKRPEREPEAERDTIQDLLREGELEGVGERDEIAIISGVVQFSEKVVRDVMTPRSEIFALSDSISAHSMATEIAQSRYSRVPIYHDTLDDVKGMVHAFDVIKAHGDRKAPLRPVAFSAPGAPCNELLFRMLRDRVHLAIVRDETGRTLGLVSLEDLLEELVGDIRDEHDEPEPPRIAK